MRFKHDCENCKPLGEFGEADLYFCDTPWIGVTVVARYSDEGSDYVSGMELAKWQTTCFRRLTRNSGACRLYRHVPWNVELAIYDRKARNEELLFKRNRTVE